MLNGCIEWVLSWVGTVGVLWGLRVAGPGVSGRCE